ncbi:hypothetical protein AB0K68_19515 [Streptomyces sp. NPDC050698]
MRTSTTLTAAFALLLAALTACAGTEAEADAQACKKAVYEQYRDTVAAGDDTPRTQKPSECAGIDDRTLKRLAGEAIKEYLASEDAEKALDDAMRDAIDDAPFEEVLPTPGPSS